MSWNKKSDIVKISTLLKNEKVILCSSDTVLGLFGQLSFESKEKIDLIKNRKNKPYLIVTSSIEKMLPFIDQAIDSNLDQLLKKHWPGPLTVIFKAKKTAPSWMKGDGNSIAVRVPKHAGLQELLKGFDGLFSTSANIAGEPLPGSLSDIDPLIKKGVSAICHDGMEQSFIPSTIIDVTDEVISVVRQGSVKID